MPYVPHKLLDFTDVGQRAENVRYSLLNRDRRTIGSLHPVVTSSIPTVSVDIGSKIARQLSNVELLRSDYAEIDPFSNLIQVEWVLEDSSAWSLGIFTFTGDPKNKQTVKLTPMADGTAWLDTESIYTVGVAKGGSLTRKMAQVCSMAGVTDIEIDSVWGNYAGEPIIWPATTTYLTILDNLCQLAGFFPPYFDRLGVLQLRRTTRLTKTAATFPGDEIVIADSPEENGNLLNIPNTHIVTGSGPTDREITAFAEVDQSLPWSVKKRGGRRIVSIHTVQGIVSSAQAKQMAIRYATTAPKDYAEVTWATTPDPRHDFYETVEIRGAIYREVAWSLPCFAGSAMSHRATRSGTVA